MNALTHAKNICLLAVVVLFSLDGVYARTIYVDEDGTAEFTTIKAAVAAAQSGDIIVVAPGTYTGDGAVDIWLGDKTLTVRSSDPDDPAVVANTIVDCRINDKFGHRFFEIGPGKDANLTLAGLTIINSARSYSGGAVLCQEAVFKAVNCTFANNAVEWWGGAIYLEDSQATFEGCRFERNVSTELRGGAVSSRNSRVVFTDCLFKENTGNAMTCFDSNVAFTDCMFENNTGSEGGAIYSHVALGNETPEDLTLTRCTFAGNSANRTGGAVHSYAAGTTISACIFTGNTALLDGGAIYNQRCTVTIVSSLFSDNRANNAGGAIIDFHLGRSEIVHCTFVANKAAQGGAVAGKRQSNSVISQCIFWKNEADTGSSLYITEDVVGGSGYAQATVEYSNVQFGRLGASVESGNVLTWGVGNIDADPMFTDPDYNDYHLSPDSPCVDAGDPDYVPRTDARDLDGLLRVNGAVADMGAYEFQGLGPVYGFRSLTSNKQFYTMSSIERDKFIELPNLWRFEGIAFYAFYDDSDSQVTPVYRFWAQALGSHLWITNEKEKHKLLNDPAFSSVWTYEGISFYVYPPGKQPLGTVPVHRFWSARLAYHFFTLEESEKNELIAEYPDVWTYEGIAWYVYLAPYQFRTTAYDFSGGSGEALYTVTFEAYVDGKEATIDRPDVDFVTRSARMRMTSDFTDLTTTLTELDIRSELASHDAVITVGSLRIPFSVSGQGTFEATTARGPFTIDAATGLFADFAGVPQILGAQRDTFSCSGSVRFTDQAIAFNHTAGAVDFELSSLGVFESMDLLPEGVNARMPLTFQWHRPDLRDLIVEASVDGRRVQLYITYMYAATQGLWRGAVVY